jgi:hypothetical protein
VGLHDHHRLGESGDDPIAHGEPPRFRAGAQRRLREEQAPLADLGPEPGVATRVDDVEARADHRLERPGVGRAVDAEGEAGDDRHAGCGQVAAELAGDVGAVPAELASADDRHPASAQHSGVAAGEEHTGAS